MDDADKVEYLTGYSGIYKAAFRLLVTSCIRSVDAKVNIAVQTELSEKVRKLLPVELAGLLPAGQCGAGIQDAIHEIVSELLGP